MTLDEVLQWLKTLSTKFDNYYIGKLDSKKDKSLGAYNLKSSGHPFIALGGLKNTSFNTKKISLLIHWTKNKVETEKIAMQLYENVMTSEVKKIGNHDVKFIGMLVPEPQDVGNDDNGICEYVIQFEIYYER